MASTTMETNGTSTGQTSTGTSAGQTSSGTSTDQASTGASTDQTTAGASTDQTSTGASGSTTTGNNASGTTSGSSSGATETGSSSSLQSSDHVFVTELSPSNNSGAHGLAGFVLSGNTLTAEVAAEGLTPNQVHEMHIHGFSNGIQSELPTLAEDANHDGLIQDTEAETSAGPVVLSLTQSGTVTNNESVNDFPPAGSDGTLTLHQTYTFNATDPTQSSILNELQSLNHDAVEVHGEVIPEAPGSSTTSYDPSIPVAGGLLHEVTGTTLGAEVGADVLNSDPTSLLALNSVDPFAAGHG